MLFLDSLQRRVKQSDCFWRHHSPRHHGMSSNLIPVANRGKAENKHTNQPEHLPFIASVFTNAHWDARDDKDKNTSVEQRGKKRTNRLAQPLYPPRSHQRGVLRACVKSIYHFNIEVPWKILRVNFAVIPTYGKTLKYRRILKKLENLNEYLLLLKSTLVLDLPVFCPPPPPPIFGYSTFFQANKPTYLRHPQQHNMQVQSGKKEEKLLFMS